MKKVKSKNAKRLLRRHRTYYYAGEGTPRTEYHLTKREIYAIIHAAEQEARADFIDPEEAAIKMGEFHGRGIEAGHEYADEYMCEILRAAGYREAVKAFEDLGKWYS